MSARHFIFIREERRMRRKSRRMLGVCFNDLKGPSLSKRRWRDAFESRRDKEASYNKI
jgi:hypothetical protein